MHAVLCGGLDDIHAGIMVALDKLQPAAGKHSHVPANNTQAGKRGGRLAAESHDLLPIRNLLPHEADSGHGMDLIIVAALVQPVGYDSAAGWVHLAENSAAMGIVHMQAPVSNAKSRAEYLKPVFVYKAYEANGIEGGRVILCQLRG